ncbi:MAG: hypothetical protein NZM08_01300 [Chitinophagales bacterium]|nr:hypothetical protein [Chitinophagales bacterium]
MKRLWLLLWLVPAASQLGAQSVWHLNYATSLGGGCFHLTKNKDGQRASVWNDQLLDLTKPFRLNYRLNFGNKDQGADGISIVFHQDPAGYAAIGYQGADLGYASASYGNDSIAPSLIIEFDTYNNGQWQYNDIVDDHCQINAGGIPSWTLAFAVPVAGPGVNVEDDAYHFVQVTWDPASMMLNVYFNCNLIQSLNVDLVNWLFAGNAMVYYGITAATGKANNNQYFCELWHTAGNDLTFCPGTPVALAASSNFQSVSWTPATGLSCTNCLNPVANPAGPMTYVFTGIYDCLTVTDTVKLIQDCTFLPVELQHFDGRCQQGVVELQWVTASERNNSHFEVERSADGSAFYTIGRVEGAGTSAEQNRYSFRDTAPLAGTSYYRLKQVDWDATATFSPVITARCNTGATASVFPNPSGGSFSLRLFGAEPQQVACRMLTPAGVTVKATILSVSGQPQLFDFDTSEVPPGIYLLVLYLTDQVITIPLAVGY